MEYKSKILTDSKHWEENQSGFFVLMARLSLSGLSATLYFIRFTAPHCLGREIVMQQPTYDIMGGTNAGRLKFSNIWNVDGSLEVTTATIQVEVTHTFHYAEWYAEWSPLFTYKWSRELCSYHMWSLALILPITPWLWRNRARWNCGLLRIKNGLFIPRSNSHGDHLQNMNLTLKES